MARSKEMIADEAAKCYELRLKGWSHREISKELEMAPSTVEQRIKLFINNKVPPLAEQYRSILIDRLEAQYRIQDEKAKADNQDSLAASQAATNTVMKMFEVSGLKSIDAPPPAIVVLDQSTSEAVQNARKINEERRAMIMNSIPGDVVRHNDTGSP